MHPVSNPIELLSDECQQDETAEVTPEWPAPKSAMEAARRFVLDIVKQNRSVLIAPDKDADGLTGNKSVEGKDSGSCPQLAVSFTTPSEHWAIRRSGFMCTTWLRAITYTPSPNAFV